MQEIYDEIEFYRSKLIEAKAKLFDIEHKKHDKNVKVISQKITDNWSLYQGDCVEVIKGIPSNSIHYSIFSPPFLSLYVYSDNERDMGNSKTDSEFYEHFEYLISELFRVIMPGRLVSVHCSIVLMSLAKDGVIGLKDFPGMIVRLFEKQNFIYHSKVGIWKDPLIQAVRTKALGLMHKQLVKDSARCNHGFMDEILTFRKPGDNLEPVSHGRGFEYYVGSDPEPIESKNDIQGKNRYSQKVFRRYADPVWMDIDQTDTLNIRIARDKKDERHIAPLQLQAIARCLHYWTNPGDIVLSPFAGIGSEGYESIKMGRKFIGIELKKSYYITAIRNLIKAQKMGGKRLL